MENKIKVVHIITRLDRGGSSYNTIDTVAGLNARGFEAELISGKTVDPEGDISYLIDTKKVKCVFINDLIRSIHPLKDLKAFISLYLYLRNSSCHIVHTHSSKAGILGRWAAWFAGKRVIIHTPHGHVFYGYFNRFITGCFIFVERLSALITDKIITLTQKGKKEHVKFGIAKADKFVPIYSGIDISLFKNVRCNVKTLKAELGVRDDAFVFGCLARLDPVKGNQFLIEAMSVVVKEFPQVQLVLIGDGEEAETLKKLTRELNIEKNVIFTGFRTDVNQCIQIFDVFVLGSLNEGMGRVILEAMAAAKPVIASRTGGIPELIEEGKNGILVDVGNVQGFADAMINLLKNPDKVLKMGSNALQMVEDSFSMNSMIDKIAALYKEICIQKL